MWCQHYVSTPLWLQKSPAMQGANSQGRCPWRGGGNPGGSRSPGRGRNPAASPVPTRARAPGPGHPEFQNKRQYLINGADPQLAATASGILLANGCLTQGQHTAALRYAWAHALVYGKPWRQICPLGDPVGSEPPKMQAIAKDKLAKMDARLDHKQRKAVADVAVFGFLPMWWIAAKLRLRAMPEDESDRQALLSGLDALAE